MIDEVKPIESMRSEYKHMGYFLEDLEQYDDIVYEKYDEDFKKLRDLTCLLRSEYSMLESKIEVNGDVLLKC